MGEIPSTHTVATKTIAPPKETGSLKNKVEELKITIDQSKEKLENLVKLYDQTPLDVKNELDSDGHISNESYLIQSGELLQFFKEISDNSDNKISKLNSSKELKATIDEKINFLNAQQKDRSKRFFFDDQMMLNVNENISDEELKNLIDSNIKNINGNRHSVFCEEFINKILEINTKYENTKDELFLNDDTLNNEATEKQIVLNGNDIGGLLQLSINKNLTPIIEITQKQIDRNEPGVGTFDNLMRILQDMTHIDDDDYLDVQKWQVIKNSKKFNEVFGTDTIKEKDDLVPKKLLQDALTSGINTEKYVEYFSYYPRQVIKNLVLIGCNKNKELQHKHVNDVLSTLSKRTDWNEVLDEVIKQEPELLSIKSILLDWTKNEKESKDNLSNLQGLSRPFLISKIETADKNYVEAALNGLSFTEKINYLINKRLIPDNDFINTNVLMQQIDQGLYKEEPYVTNIKIFSSKLESHVDNLIMINRFGVNIDKINKNMSHDGSLNFLKKFEFLMKGMIPSKILSKNDVQWLSLNSTNLLVEATSLESIEKCFAGDNNLVTPESPIFKIFDYMEYLLTRDKEFFKKNFGESGEKYLKSLPNNEIERRNAFTGNKYDHASKFLKYMYCEHKDIFSVDSKNIDILADYVKSYGFSESPLLIEIFYKLQKNDLDNLPKIAIKSGIKTIEDLKKQFDHANLIVASGRIIDKDTAKNLNPLEIELILSLTGYSKGSWTKIDFNQIIDNLPEKESEYLFGHKKSKFEINTMKFESIMSLTEQETNNYSVAIKEIIEATKNPDDISELKSNLKEIYHNYSKNMNFDKMPEAIREKNKTRLKSTVDKIENATDIDSLMIAALDVLRQNLGKDDTKIQSITRSLFFKKILTSREKISEGFIEGIKNKLDTSDEKITIEKIQQLRDLYRNYLKDHAMKDDNYWNVDADMAIKDSVKLNQKLNIRGIIETLDNIDKYLRESGKIDNQIEIESIPDRGLIGELSGYVGNACYTRVFPLLQQYENLIPYKFIIKDPSTNSTEMAGSCLVFEEKDINGDSVLLVRALNIPNLENKINVANFVENFFDQLTVTAKERKIKKIIIAPSSGTISNYAGVTNYVIDKYINGKEPIKLQNKFDFNDHNITNSCCTVREIDYNSL